MDVSQESRRSFGIVGKTVYLGGTILLSWLGMQILHELGHVAGAWGTGGRVVHVDLHPLRISQTVVRPNPRPVIVAWAGPLVGSLLPIGIWLCVRRCWRSAEGWFRFFAGFCLIANGAYLGTAVRMPVGDAFDLTRHGVAAWQLGLIGLLAVSCGLFLWNNLDVRLGLESDSGPISRRALWGVVCALAAVIFLELLWSS